MGKALKCFARTIQFNVESGTMSSIKKCLTLKEKIEIIYAYDSDQVSVRTLAKRFNIGKTQAALIVRNKENIKSQWQSGVNLKRKFAQSDGLKIDKLCLEWFAKTRSQNIPICGPLVKTKAMEIAKQLGNDKFTASDGWLQKWRKRHNISFKSISGIIFS